MRLALRILLLLTVLFLAFLASSRLCPRSAGFYVALPSNSPVLGCSDLFLTISRQHSVKINGDPVPIESLASRLKGIYGQRWKLVLLVRADRDVRFQEVVGVMAVAQGAVPNLELALLTPTAEKSTPCVPIEGLNKLN